MARSALNVSMPCIFHEDDVKIVIDGRKLLLLKRRSKYPGKKSSCSWYIPLYSGEVQRLGLSGDSLVQGEIVRIEKSGAATKPAHEIQAELDHLKQELHKILNAYANKTSVRKTVLQKQIWKIIGTELPKENYDSKSE